MANRQLTKEGFTSYTIRNIPTDLHQRMKALAEKQGISMRVWMLMAFESVATEEEADE